MEITKGANNQFDVPKGSLAAESDYGKEGNRLHDALSHKLCRMRWIGGADLHGNMHVEDYLGWEDSLENYIEWKPMLEAGKDWEASLENCIE